MSGFAHCPTCGRNIGPYYELYESMKQALFQEVWKKNEVDPEKTIITNNSTPETGPILDALGITLRCCRTRFLAHTDPSRSYL